MNWEMENEEKDFVLSKKEIKECRHKSEKRWYRFLCFINVCIILFAISCIVALVPEKTEKLSSDILGIIEEVEETSTDAKEEKKEEEEKILDAEEEDSILAYSIGILLAFFILPLAVNFYYQYYRTMSIRITPKNFPDIYERVELYAKRLGMKKVPEVYVIQQNGILNAFSSFIIRKQYIEIYADIFEIAYREHQDLDSISFVIAHEMAHIQYKHATFGYFIKILFSQAIPILGSTASRAREYSCDRLAQKITGNDGIEAMFSLMAGKHLYKMVDKEDYLEYARNVKGFFVWVVNLVADHPVMTKRIVALEKGEGNGKLY